MIRESLIRRLPEFAFALLLGGGAVLGGEAALAGLPKFLDAVAPAAQANANPSRVHRIDGIARLSLADAESRSALRDGPVAQNAPAAPDTQAQRPAIAICIDDLGEDLAGTGTAMALPKEVAMSFLPYAEATPALAQAAAERGHLVLAHVPMQALSGKDPGAMGLKPGMTPEEIARRLDWNLARVPAAMGINNHEGSRFTADAVALAPVMATLKARHLFFFDSRTGPVSKVGAVAGAAGVMTAGRDVFLDDDQQEAAVSAQLDMLAREARRSGVAIAIGHPHDVTLKLLAAWLAQDHGVTLVPLDEAMRLKAERRTKVAVR